MEPPVWERLDAEFRRWPQAKAQPAAAAEVEAAEREVGLQFPPDYREFLLRYGGAEVGSLEIFGIREPGFALEHGTETRNRVVAEQRFYKEKQGFPDIEDWIVISDDGFGNPIGIAPDGKILRIDHDRGMEVNVLAPGFLQFLARQLSEDTPPEPLSLPTFEDREQTGSRKPWWKFW